MAVLTELVEHFVVLMLENRSYDLMLGGLRDPKYAGIADGTELPCEGPLGPTVRLKHALPPDQIDPDPKHGMNDVRAQIYGAPPPQQEANMMGFARNYYQKQLSPPGFKGDARARMADFATIYAEGSLPVLHTLAKQYAVCTHWFSSLPSLTSPNRAFAHAGTSRGIVEQATFDWLGLIGNRTVFDLLPRTSQAWRVYHSGPPHLWLMGDEWFLDKKDNFRSFSRFKRDVAANSLPTYTFIEPRHWPSHQGTSQHPPQKVSSGEQLIASVYDTLLSNFELFEKTLFLIVYDEHGGFFDHVIPPGHPGWELQQPHLPHQVVPPDEKRAPDFAFDQLGVRVPAVLITPWLDAGTTTGWNAAEAGMRRTFDHTSILATIDHLAPRSRVLQHSQRALAATALNLPARASARTRGECPGPLLPQFSVASYRGARTPSAAVARAAPVSASASASASGAAAVPAAPVSAGPDGGPERELLDAWEARTGNRNWQELEEHTEQLLTP